MAQAAVRADLDEAFDVERHLAAQVALHLVATLTNLISNALRYSHDNASVQLGINLLNDKIVFSVRDTGQGISTEYIDKIFDRYFRIPGSKKEGTGLGLSISKEFIEALGGSIHVKSDLASGSSFSVMLPIEKI